MLTSSYCGIKTIDGSAYTDLLPIALVAIDKNGYSNHFIGTAKGLFTRRVNVTIFGCSTFDLFDVMSKQHHGSALNSFLNGTKKAVTLTVCVNEV